MKKLVAILCLTISSAAYQTATAQTSGATMLAPGIYTTPEISARCQTYTRGRVGSSSAGDSERQSVFLACVQRLSRDQNGSVTAAPVAAPIVAAPIVSAPVALPQYEISYSAPLACWTDEGYGRFGSCDSF